MRSMVDELAPPVPGPATQQTRRQLGVLVVHLARRELASAHRFTLLGWAWPLLRQLAQLAVLVFVFSSVLDAGIENYATYVFCGLLLFSWFSSGVSAATRSLLQGRHLVFSPRFPTRALPLVAMVVPLVDLLTALPLLLLLVGLQSGLSATALLFPLLLVLEFVFIAGLALALSALNVFVRDVENVVGVGLLLLFYLTPVFYGLRALPPHLLPFLNLNPMTAMVESSRFLLLDGTLPGPGYIVRIVASAGIALGAGVLIFSRLEHRFVDEL